MVEIYGVWIGWYTFEGTLEVLIYYKKELADPRETTSPGTAGPPDVKNIRIHK